MHLGVRVILFLQAGPQLLVGGAPADLHLHRPVDQLADGLLGLTALLDLPLLIVPLFQLFKTDIEQRLILRNHPRILMFSLRISLALEPRFLTVLVLVDVEVVHISEAQAGVFWRDGFAFVDRKDCGFSEDVGGGQSVNVVHPNSVVFDASFGVVDRVQANGQVFYEAQFVGFHRFAEDLEDLDAP